MMRKILAGLAVLIVVAFAIREYRARPADMAVTPLAIETAAGPARFTVELATTSQQQEQGLMFRKSLAPDAGMLFDLQVAKPISFWMKDTLIALDIVFIKADGAVARIAANAKPNSLDLIPSNEPVRAVLEIPGGRAAELGIKPGDHVAHAIFGNAPH